MNRSSCLRRAAPAIAVLLLASGPAPAAEMPHTAPSVINPPPKPADWAALAKLPDWSGVWTPDIRDQFAANKRDVPPWTPKAAAQIAAMEKAEKDGTPTEIFQDCLPEAMPSWMLISHNAMEILFTPGRVTMLGESDGNRLRRIYTDGRAHLPDPDLTFHGDSIGHWEGGTLVVDTIGILPETWIGIEESVGVHNDGDMHIVERIHLTGPDTLRDDLEITAPHVLTAPWKTSRIFYRQRARKYDIVEGVCQQGFFTEAKDKDGDAVFEPLRLDSGIPVPTQSK
jgi:hypothetical protein